MSVAAASASLAATKLERKIEDNAVRRRVLVSGPLKPRAAAHLRTAVSASTGAACINTVKEIPRPLESKLQEDNALIADVAAKEAGMAARWGGASAQAGGAL